MSVALKRRLARVESRKPLTVESVLARLETLSSDEDMETFIRSLPDDILDEVIIRLGGN